jgi:hypothetical protein
VVAGVRDGGVEPAAAAASTNAALSKGRFGNPCETFETPRTVESPSACARRTTSSVTAGAPESVAAVITSPSTTRSASTMPCACAVARTRSIISARPVAS